MTSKAKGVKKYIVVLSVEERKYLEDIVSKGRDAAGRLSKARILLKADEGWSDRRIVEALSSSMSTVQRARQRFVEQSLEAAISRKKNAKHHPLIPFLMVRRKPG